MHNSSHFLHIILVLIFLSFGCKEEALPEFVIDATQGQNLKAHSAEFEKDVIKVTDNIHVAIGYGLANSIIIEGDEGCIIVDCMESKKSALSVKAEFDKICTKPVKALIYTHFHPDHTFGADIIAGKDTPIVIAHETTSHELDKLVNIIRPIIGKRSYRMFGNFLSPEEHINSGIGPKLNMDETLHMGALRPNLTFAEQMDTSIAGIDLTFYHAPGETDDQIFVWLENEKILLPGDNLYKAFPNLYTIRGTSYRDIKKWVSSIDKMRKLRPKILIPSHTQPIVGEEEVYKALTDYRDAIQYVHDQTIRHMNLGLTIDEIVAAVKLPPSLASSPYLQEYYGRVDWSVKSVFTGYLGFFDGNPSMLIPTIGLEKAQEMASLAGGSPALLEKAQLALKNEKHQWALELTDHLKLLDVDQTIVLDIRVKCLVYLGEHQNNPNARHYYLSCAKELVRKKRKPSTLTKEAASRVPLKAVFDGLMVNLIPKKSTGIDKKMVIHFSDLDTSWSMHVRNGIAEIQNEAIDGADIKVETTSEAWKSLILGIKGGLRSIASGDVKVTEGGVSEFSAFMGMFKAE